MKSLALILVTLVGVTACATKPQYSNPSIADPAQAARQLAIDDGECTMVAVSGAPIPQVQVSGSGGQTVSGTITSGAKTYNYSGTTTPSGSFSSGFANGMNTGAAMRAKADQGKIHHGCMLSKGWSAGPSQ